MNGSTTPVAEIWTLSAVDFVSDFLSRRCSKWDSLSVKFETKTNTKKTLDTQNDSSTHYNTMPFQSATRTHADTQYTLQTPLPAIKAATRSFSKPVAAISRVGIRSLCDSYTPWYPGESVNLRDSDTDSGKSLGTFIDRSGRHDRCTLKPCHPHGCVSSVSAPSPNFR